jgi:hypothetical protein
MAAIILSWKFNTVEACYCVHIMEENTRNAGVHFIIKQASLGDAELQ